MGKKKLSAKDKKVLYILGAIALVAAAYFLVFSKLNEKKAELVDQNAQLQTEVSKLSTMEAQKDSVIEDTQKHQEMIAEVLGKFPSEVRTEDAIYDLYDMYKGISDVKIQSENYTMNQIFYQQGALTSDSTVSASASSPDASAAPASDETQVEKVTKDTPAADVVKAAANYTGYRSTVAVVFTAPYNSMKKVVNYINDSDKRMTITDISATKNDDTNELSCTMNVNMYSVSGTGELYEAPDIANNNKGVDNLFRN